MIGKTVKVIIDRPLGTYHLNLIHISESTLCPVQTYTIPDALAFPLLRYYQSTVSKDKNSL